MDYRYKAFISYRHYTPDQEIAQKLHAYIENYAVPAKVKKGLGIRKMGRVFRDQEELPLSADLGEDIHTALEESEWLVCVCSPRYVESRWCMEELRYFLSLGRRDHVLTVLADGDPDTSFPEALRTVEKDGRLIAVEPLAADVRAETLPEMLKKLKNEKLRIIAPMLGVRFDDLKQRARQRRYRQAALAGAAVILLLSGFLGYSLRKNAQITEERNRTMVSQSRFLANEAGLLLQQGGDRALAMMLAREALPRDCEHPDRPVTDEALCALRSSLLFGLEAGQYVTVTDLNLSVRTFNADGERLAVCSDDAEGFVACFRLENGQEEDFPLKMRIRPHRAEFSPDLRTIVYGDTGGFHKAVLDEGGGLQVKDYSVFYSSQGLPFAISREWDSFATNEIGGYHIRMAAPGAEFFDLKVTGTGTIRAYLSDTAGAEGTPDGKFLTWFPGEPASGDLVMLKAAENPASCDEMVLHRYFITAAPDPGEKCLSWDTLNRYGSSYDGTRIIGKADGAVHVWDTFTGEQEAALFSYSLDGSELKEITVSPAENRVAVITEKDLYLYDYTTGETERLGRRVDSAWFSPDGRQLLCADLASGTALVVSEGYKKLQIDQEIRPDFDLTGAYFARRDLRGNGTDSRYILLTGENKARLMKTDETLPAGLVRAVPVPSVRYKEEAVLSPDGREAWFFTSEKDHYRLNVYNFETDELSVIREFQDTLHLTFCHGLSRIGDRYAVLTGEDYGTKEGILCLYDLKTHALIRETHPEIGGMIGMRQACRNGDYAVFRNTKSDRGPFIVLDAHTGDPVCLDGTIPEGDYVYRLEGQYLFVLNGKGDRLVTPPIDLKNPPEENIHFKEKFYGFFENARLPGFSARIAAYVTDGRICLMDPENGKETRLEAEPPENIFLSAGGQGLILYSAGGAGSCLLYTGGTPAPYEASWKELHPEPAPAREYMPGGRWAYLSEGALYDSETGVKQIDFHNRNMQVTDQAYDGSALLIRGTGAGLARVLYPDGNSLLEMAEAYLQQKEMSPAEREQFFVD